MTLEPEIRRRVLDAAERRGDDAIELLRELIRIPSETHPPTGDEGPCQRFVEARMRELGLA